MFLFPKYAKTHLRASAIPTIFSGIIPRTPVKGEGNGFRREGERIGGEGMKIRREEGLREGMERKRKGKEE